MRIRNDDSIQSSNTPTADNYGRMLDFGLYRCVIRDVIYVDNPRNITQNSSNPRVLYDVVVLGGFSSGQVLSNCRLASSLGGNDSFSERTLRASSKKVSGNRLSEQDGDVVLVFFIQGHTAYPLIVALDNGLNTFGKIGASLSEGPRSIEQYNGVREEINKDGEWELKIKGGSATSVLGAFLPNSDAQVTLKIDKNEKFTRTFKSGLKIEEDGKNDFTIITTAGGAKVTIDGKNDKILLNTAGGSKVTIEGQIDKITSETSGGAKVTVDGNADTIEAKTSGGGELKLDNNKVALGASPEETLQILSETLQELSVTLGNLGYPLSGAPIFASLKTRIDSIKGTL